MKITRSQLGKLIRDAILIKESESDFTLGYGSNEPTKEEHEENIRMIEQAFEEVREEFIGCAKEVIGRKAEEGYYGELKSVPFNDWPDMIPAMNTSCSSPMFGRMLVNADADELLAFFMRVFMARTNLILITGPRDQKWGSERRVSGKMENDAFFRSDFGARVKGRGDTRRQIKRHLEGDHNTIYFYMYGTDQAIANSVDSMFIDQIKDTLAHEFGHARQKLTQGLGQALITSLGLDPTLEEIDEGLVENLIEPWLYSEIPVPDEGISFDAQDKVQDKWYELGGSEDNEILIFTVIDWLGSRMYSHNEVHNILTTDLRRELLKMYGPLPGISGDEVKEFYKDALDEFLEMTIPEVDATDIPNIDGFGYKMLLKDNWDAVDAYGELAMISHDKETTG